MEIPSKKRRVEEKPDFGKCIICQEETRESLVQSVSEEAYASVLHFAYSRTACGENEFATISRLLEGVSAEELRQNNASFHARCRKRLVNSAMLKRAEARFEKAASSQNTSILSRPPGRPSFASQTGSSTPVVFHGLTEQTSKRILRSSTATFNRKLCFFCQSHDDKQDIHVIQTENRRKQLLEFVKNCHNDLYKVYLTSTIEPEDALPKDVHYHRACWMKHVIRAMTPEDKARADAQDSEQENKVAADIEFLHLIQELLKKGKILSLEDAQKVYTNILQDHLCYWFPSRKSVRQLLAENVDGIEFVSAYRRNESDRFCLSAAKIAAIEKAVKQSSHINSELEVLYDCSKIIRREILEANTWHFKGTLDIDAQDIVPTKLFTLLKCILSGMVSELKTEQRAEDVNRKSVLLAQQIMYQTKTDRQVRYVPQLDEEGKTFRHQREYPLQVGVGLLAHQKMRSKSVIDVLHELGVSVNYARILRIETQLAQAVLSNSSEHSIFIPPKLCKGQFIFFSVDNSDFSEDTPDGKNTLHAIAMVVFQRKRTKDPETILEVDATMRTKSLPQAQGPRPRPPGFPNWRDAHDNGFFARSWGINRWQWL